MLDAPRYVTNAVIRTDFEIEMVNKEIERYSENDEKRLRTHPKQIGDRLTK